MASQRKDETYEEFLARAAELERLRREDPVIGERMRQLKSEWHRRKRASMTEEERAALREEHRRRWADDPEYRERKAKRDRKAAAKRWATDPDGCRRRSAKSRRLKKFGVPDVGGYYTGTCELCGKPDDKLVQDHNHKTGALRGLLCNRCNMCLGSFGDDIAGIMVVVNYLIRHGERS